MLKKELEEEAEKIEREAKEAKAKKDFDSALLLFERARLMNQQLGFQGKVNYIEKQIEQINKASGATTPAYKSEYGVSYERQKVEEIRERSKRIVQQRMEAAAQNSEIWTETEERRRRIEKQMEEKKLKDKLEQERLEKLKKQELLKQQKILKETRLQSEFEQKAMKEEELKQKADKALTQAKSNLEHHKYKDARKNYREAIQTLKELGWFDQVDMLYEEVKNIEKYEFEYYKEMEEKAQKRKEQEEAFQKRVEVALTEKEKIQEELARKEGLSPEQEMQLEKAKMIIDKAENEEKAGQYEKALGRYKYLLDIYKSLPSDKLNLSEEIARLEKKISELELNVN